MRQQEFPMKTVIQNNHVSTIGHYTLDHLKVWPVRVNSVYFIHIFKTIEIL